METCVNRSKQAKEMHECQNQLEEGQKREKESIANGSGVVKERSLVSEKGGLRVKIVVTKEELEWLMVQLNNKGGKSLEDVLGEIERGREKVEPWKPSLDSIMECPEVAQEMDR